MKRRRCTNNEHLCSTCGFTTASAGAGRREDAGGDENVRTRMRRTEWHALEDRGWNHVLLGCRLDHRLPRVARAGNHEAELEVPLCARAMLTSLLY